MDENGELQTDNKIKAELLNKFFQSVFTIEDTTQGIPIFPPSGPDQMHPKFLKETAKNIAEPLTKIFQKSIETRKIPNTWKLANVTPLHKKGPKQQVTNYLPISLTSIICKSMEKFVKDSLMNHMESNQLFTNGQHGFRKGRSCITQLIEVMEDWTEHLDNHNSVDAIYLDFQKAFDTVPHHRLFTKLKGYGISGNILEWIKNFLSERKQKVVLNGSNSKWTDVTNVIPQGSVLGHILFTIYINDLPDVVQNVAKLFADDTKLYAAVNNTNDEIKLQGDIDRLMQWSKEWLLTFNKSKCKHVHFGPPNNASRYQMGGDIITQCTEEKDLGITIDEKLKFQIHINNQTKKANQRLGMIKRSFTYMDKNMFTTLYKSIVRPHLEYGSNIWSVMYKKEAIQIENVQRRATKLVKNIQHLSYSDRSRYLGLPSLQYRRLRSDMVEMFRIINNIDKVNSNKIFPKNENTTRGHKHKIYKKQCRTNIRKYSFSQRVVDTWNSLPAKVIESNTVNGFKNQLNSHWKDLEIKFKPDIYKPEVTNGYDKSRRVGGEN